MANPAKTVKNSEGSHYSKIHTIIATNINFKSHCFFFLERKKRKQIFIV